MIRLYHLIYATFLVAMYKPREQENGASAVEWLLVVGAGIGIAYFAGDAVMAFAKNAVGSLGR